MPDFECLFDTNSCVMLRDAYDAITRLDLWGWMHTFTPHSNEGFMLTTHPQLDRISMEMKYLGHSGASWGLTMRTMEAIAKSGGWDAYKAAAIARWPASRPVCECRAEKGMSIGWCGVAGFGVPGCEH
jgi:hypothetical protein